MEGQKVVTAQEMGRVEKLSIDEGASDENYMLRAGKEITSQAETFIHLYKREKKVVLLIGKGNNGGDAYVVGKFLIQKCYAVKAYHLFSLADSSPMCRKQGQAYAEAGGEVHFPKNAHELTFFTKGIIIDGLLGTGFQGKLKGLLLSVIEHVNQSKVPTLAIDIPSGVNGNNGTVIPTAIMATETIFLGLPKLGFFLGEGYNHIGILRFANFGMDLGYLQKMQAQAHLINEKSLPALIPHLNRNQHKYQAGYVLAIAGSPGMPGAGILSTLAALRSGAGIACLFHPEGMEQELAAAPYELIRAPYSYGDPSAIWEEQKRAGACLIGPGLGKEEEMHTFLKKTLFNLNIPVVIDADGLFHLKDELKTLNVPCVITPHHKEMLYLLEKDSFLEGEMLNLCQDFSVENNVTLVLKGAPTFIFHPRTPPLIIPKGDPGMATAGTGDVLTGMIAALLAKKLSSRQAAVLGVYLHALSGEIVAAKRTSYNMIASDLIEAFPAAFKTVVQTPELR